MHSELIKFFIIFYFECIVKKKKSADKDTGLSVGPCHGPDCIGLYLSWFPNGFFKILFLFCFIFFFFF